MVSISDRVLSRSRVVGIESPAVGWLAVAVAHCGKAAIERVRRGMQQK